MWADDAVFAPSDFSGQGTSGTGSAISATVDGVTIACDKGYGTTQIRCYSGSKITISSNNTITAISFTFSGTNTGGLETSYTDLSTTSWEKTLSSQARITAITVTYSGSATPVCATPTFSPAAGAVLSGTAVSIETTTPDATIYYTMGSNPADPTTSSTKYESSITITEATTIKAIAVMEGYENSKVASAEYTIKEAVSGYTIDFESDIDSYSDWTFTNVGTTNTAITAHGGNKYGANVNASGNGTETCIIQTKEKVANPGTLTFWISKVSNNTTASSWYVEVSEDGTSWTQVGDAQSAAEMTKGEWTKVERDMTDYSNVYVRIRYGSSSAIRTIDDISLTMSNPNQPSISAENVSLVYDATSGEIPYTINNPVAGTTLTATTEAEWISNFTVASDKVTFTATANDGAERTATVTLIYGNLTKEVTVSQAANPNAPGTENKPYTVAEARAAIDAGTGVTEVYATGIVSEIVTAYNSTYSNVTFDIVDEAGTSASLRAYRCTGDKAAEVAVGDVVVVKGNLTKYNSTYEFGQGCEIVSLQHPVTPSITVDKTEISATAEETEGTINVTYSNISEVVAEVKFYEADGTTEKDYDWIIAEVNETTNNVDYTIEANTGDARTAYLKVCAFDDELNEVCSDLITITQAAYEAPFEGATYTRASTITPGKHYIIASEADAEGNAYAMGGQNSNNRAAVAIKVDGNKAQVNSADVREFVISIPEADGLYAIFDETEGGYLYAASSDKNYLRTETTLDDNGKWTIEFAEGVATIKAQGTNTRNWMRFNDSNKLFSCYAEENTQADVYLYEKDEDKTTVVTISELGYATFGSAEAVDFSEEANLTVYTAKVNDTNSEVELTEVSGKTVPAGEAVLLKGEAGTYTGKVIESADRLTDNDLKLATADLTGNGKIYVLNKVDDKVGFYKLSAEGTLSKGKAYLESESAAPFLGFDGEDTTGINSVERGTLSVEGCYTLDGRRVAQPTKGLYIVNGKKVVIK